MRKVSDKGCRENVNTHFVSITFSPKLCHLQDNVEKYCTSRQAACDNINTVHVCWMLGNEGYRYTIRICMLTAFPWQLWFCELTSILCSYIHCLSYFYMGVEFLVNLYKKNIL